MAPNYGHAIRNEKETCAVSDLITSFAALDLADSSVASDIASWAFLADLCSSNS